jgi:hypothetical protein
MAVRNTLQYCVGLVNECRTPGAASVHRELLGRLGTSALDALGKVADHLYGVAGELSHAQAAPGLGRAHVGEKVVDALAAGLGSLRTELPPPQPTCPVFASGATIRTAR